MNELAVSSNLVSSCPCNPFSISDAAHLNRTYQLVIYIYIIRKDLYPKAVERERVSEFVYYYCCVREE